MKLNFRYRYVGYGMQFHPVAKAQRTATAKPEELYANELVVDVGGACLGIEGEERAILDHHFYRARGQYPSAAAAVLHQACQVREKLGGSEGDFWLVAHRQPDFDAYGAMYLARGILTGEIPAAGWEQAGIHSGGWSGGRGEIAWFNPRLDGLTPERRWPILLAAFASLVDAGRRLTCPRERALHSILYAADLRGRDYRSETSGAVEFFDEVKKAIGAGRNPLCDSVLENRRMFEPELQLLDREAAAYARDIRRSRRTVVYLQKAPTDFQQWFPCLQGLPLFDASGQLQPAHLHPEGHTYAQADGIFLRDPESLLFKEWARMDPEHSSMGRGFLFTAVANSSGCTGTSRNTSRYRFALDRERAGTLHLYNVWARLQEEEIRTMREPAQAQFFRQCQEENRPPRPGFENRAAGPYRDLLFDPWFDGHNYDCTILDTPSQGTWIAPGQLPDLSDDPVARIVEQELERAIFKPTARWIDYPKSIRASDPVIHERPVLGPRTEEAVHPDRAYRFCRAELDAGVDLLQGDIAEKIGRTLWRQLQPGADQSLPANFADEHLETAAGWVGVWSGRGVAMAYQQDALEKVEKAQGLFQRLVTLARQQRRLTRAVATLSRGEETLDSGGQNAEPAMEKKRKVLRFGERLIQQEAAVRAELAQPDCRLISRFFEASRLHETLQTLRDVYLAATEHAQADAMNRNVVELRKLQSNMEWVEAFVVGVYAVELAEVLHKSIHGGAGEGHMRHWYLLVAIALSVPLLILWLLQPYKHKILPTGRLVVVVLAIVALFAALLISLP